MKLSANKIYTIDINKNNNKTINQKVMQIANNNKFNNSNQIHNKQKKVHNKSKCSTWNKILLYNESKSNIKIV